MSRILADIDSRVGAFFNRPLKSYWPNLWPDNVHINARRSGRIVSEAAKMALGDNVDVRRKVLPRSECSIHSPASWESLLDPPRPRSSETGSCSPSLTVACGA